MRQKGQNGIGTEMDLARVRAHKRSPKWGREGWYDVSALENRRLSPDLAQFGAQERQTGRVHHSYSSTSFRIAGLQTRPLLPFAVLVQSGASGTRLLVYSFSFLGLLGV